MPSAPGSRLLVMHDHAGTVIGGMQLFIRPHAPMLRSFAKVGRSPGQRSTSVGSRQSRPMMTVFTDAELHVAPDAVEAGERLAFLRRVCYQRAMSRRFSLLVWIIALLFFGCFLVWPIVQSLRGAFLDPNGALTFSYFAEIFRNRIYVEGLRNALLLALASTAATFAIAMPLAWLADRFDFPGKKIFATLLLVPMILPPFVGAIGVRRMLGQMGAFNALLHHLGLLAPDATIDWLGRGRFWGCVILNALHLYPVLYLNLVAALANIDPAMEEAAENLGCTGFRKFRKITLPLIMPGIFAGGTIVFIWAFTELGVPLMFDYLRVTPVQIFYGIKEIGGNPLPYALVVVTLAATALLYLASKLIFGRTSHAMLTKASTASVSRP